MSAKLLLFRSDARETLLRGAAAVADAVRVTLGPKSKCVLIDKRFGHPLVCNDGVTIARELELKDPVENLGAKVLREAAENAPKDFSIDVVRWLRTCQAREQTLANKVSGAGEAAEFFGKAADEIECLRAKTRLIL